MGNNRDGRRRFGSESSRRHRGIDENGRLLADLVGAGREAAAEAVAVLGNAALASRVRKGPRFRTPRKGPETTLELAVADVGLVGFRRSGKCWCRRFGGQAEIADYPFTLVPKPRVVSAGEHVHRRRRAS